LNAPTFIHAEADLVAALGLARALVRDVRTEQLTRGTHWQHVAGAVRYSDEGRDRLHLILKAEPQKNLAEIPAEPGAEPAEPSGLRELVCLRTYTMNRRIVQAQLGEEIVRVRVKDSAKLTAGMVMRCTHVQADMWELAQPLPRWRGKW
jgi:hypothetical protein